jgi:nucleoside-diphosphate-sugar epimerase
MARIVVTGATGFVGGRVAARLRDRGDEVVALTRRHDDRLAALGSSNAWST